MTNSKNQALHGNIFSLSSTNFNNTVTCETVLVRCQNWDKLPKFVVFWTILTIQYEKSAAKFHYIKTVSGKVVAQ